jgi:hypothetical protein
VQQLEQQVRTLEQRKCNHEDLKLVQARANKIQRELAAVKATGDKNKDKNKYLNE